MRTGYSGVFSVALKTFNSLIEELLFEVLKGAADTLNSIISV